MIKKWTFYAMLTLSLLALTLAAGCGKDGPDDPPIDDGTEWKVYNFGFTNLTVRCIDIDQQNRKWIGTEGYGVIVFDDQDSTWIIHNQIDSYIRAIHVADDGAIWVGAEYSGVWKYNGSTWTNYSLPDTDVISITTDHNGVVWAGTSECGLARFDGLTWTIYEMSNSEIPSNRIASLAVDHDNNLWIGAARYQTGGLVKFDGSAWTVYNTSNSELPDGYPVNLTTDRNNHIWFSSGGTIRYLIIIDEDDWSLYKIYDYLKVDGGIRGITFDDEGVPWFAMNVYGFVKMDGGNWIRYNPPDYNMPGGILETIIYDAHSDCLWLGTAGSGLLMFKEAK